jgi:hypothetical protein
MRFLLLAALALPAASAALPPPPGLAATSARTDRDCPADRSLRMANRPFRNRGVTTLGEEPLADLAYAVWSHVNGCYRPVKIREGIGFGAGQPPSDPLARP